MNYTSPIKVTNKARSLALRRCIFSLLPHLMHGIFWTAIVYGVAEVFLAVRNAEGNPGLWFRLLAIVPMCFILNILRLYFTNRYILGRHRVHVYRGLLSFKLEKPTVDYSDIREIQVLQGFIGRIFNFGDLVLATAGTDSFQAVLHGIANPYTVQKILEERRIMRQAKLSNNTQLATASGE